MPAMLRWNKKADKIAFSIIGKPAVFAEKKTEKQKKIDAQALAQYTSQVR